MIDIIKFDKPEQFPKDEIFNEDDRLVRSWASVEIRDKQGDIVPINQLKRVMNTWFKRGATMIDQHSNRPIGKGLSWKIETEPTSGKEGICLDYQVFDDYTIDDQVWKEIKDQKRTGLSIGGRALGVPRMKKDDYSGVVGKYLQDIEIYEISPVDEPANQLGKNIAINYLAKSAGMSKEDFKIQIGKDLQKGYAVIDTDKPFAGYKNFKDCVDAQIKRGHTEDGAKRVAQFLMHLTNEKFVNGELKYNGSKDVKKSIEDYNWEEDSDNVAYIGLMVESEEHPDVSEKDLKQLVADHLSEDAGYYDKKKADVIKKIEKAFADYPNFAACVLDNEDKSNPEAYCAQLHYNVTGKWPGEMKKEENPVIKALNSPIKKKAKWPGNFVKAVTKPKKFK